MKRFDQFEQASLTDVGIRRSHNQDNLCVLTATDEEHWRQSGHLFLVADGMGAHAVGEKASEKAAQLIPHNYQKYSPQGPIQAIKKAFTEANANIHSFGQQNREFEGTGTTSSALVLRPEGAWLGHVGDSRVYRIRTGVIEQLTYDHSLVWEFARIKNIDPSEVKDIPTNVIHRCLGPEAAVQVDVEGPHPLLPGDIFVLCSDGLSGQVSDQELGVAVSVLPPAEACRFLVDLANLRGGPDNITVIVVRVGGNPESISGVFPAVPNQAGFSLFSPTLWWLPTLGAGALLVLLAIVLQNLLIPGGAALAAFLLGAGAIGAGLVGFVIHQNRQRNEVDDEDQPQPRVHRRTPFRLDQTLLDKLARAVGTLRQRAEENHWDPNWNVFWEHYRKAEDFQKQGDITASFREFCRAMLPLTHALQKHRNKEESFKPLWDKES